MNSPNSTSSARPRHANADARAHFDDAFEDLERTPLRPPMIPMNHHARDREVRSFLPWNADSGDEGWFSFRNVALGFSVLLFLCYVLAIVWTLMHPVPPSLSMASAALSDFQFVGTEATADCSVVLFFLNRNRQVTALFDWVEIKLIYPPKEAVLSQYNLLPFQLTATKSTAVKADLSFAGVDIGIEVSSAMRRDIALGNLTLVIKMEAVVSFGNSGMKMTPQYIEGYCSGVSFGFQPGDNHQGIFLNLFIECHSYQVD